MWVNAGGDSPDTAGSGPESRPTRFLAGAADLCGSRWTSAPGAGGGGTGDVELPSPFVVRFPQGPDQYELNPDVVRT